MAIPEGYTALGRLGYVDKGNYAAGTTYMMGDVVYYSGSSYVALKDNLKGVTPTAGSNWKYMARGFAAEKLTQVNATDTSGMLGTSGVEVISQDLIDAIADRVMTKLLTKTSIVQTESTSTTTAPSSAYFKQVTDKVNSDLGKKVSQESYFTFLAGTTADLTCFTIGRLLLVSGYILLPATISKDQTIGTYKGFSFHETGFSAPLTNGDSLNGYLYINLSGSKENEILLKLSKSTVVNSSKTPAFICAAYTLK